MTHRTTPTIRSSRRTTRRTTRSGARLAAAALAAGAVLQAAQPAHAGSLQPPPTPDELTAPAGTKPFLVASASGTQNYRCAVDGSGFAWTFVGPQATLADSGGKYSLDHWLSPNPDEGGTLRPTWRDNRDGSTVWGRMLRSSTDPAYVRPDAIPWLLLEVVGTEPGPGGDRMASTTFIQRVNTTGGLKPSTGCSDPSQVGALQLVPYTAEYVFYKTA